MSHIEQALKQAGAQAIGDRRLEPSRLDYFPSAAVPPLRELAQPSPLSKVGPAVTPQSEALIVHEEAPRLCTEQFRTLAATLHQRQRETGLKTIMITSAHAHEGKTFTAANLGFMLSESYRRRVLLVDADLRRPSLHTVFDVANVNGLADALKGGGNTPVSVVELSQWLALMPAGTPDPDPMPSLTSGLLQPILRDAAETFDWVILDAPPVALLPDAALFASMVESVVLVIGAGLAPHHLVMRAVETLGRSKIAGVVLNRIEKGSAPDASYEHYYGGVSEPPLRKPLFRAKR